MRMAVVVVCVIMAMRMGVVVVMTPPPQAPKHPNSEKHDQNAREGRQPWLCLVDDVALAKCQRCNGQNPNDNGMADRSRDGECDCLRTRAPDRDDVRGHERFRVTGLKRMQCPQDDRDGQVKPSVRGATLDDCGQVRHVTSRDSERFNVRFGCSHIRAGNSALLTARLSLLDGRARHRAVGTEHAAIARERLESLAASFAIVKKLAGIRRHLLGRCMTAFRASNGGFYNHAAGHFIGNADQQ